MKTLLHSRAAIVVNLSLLIFLSAKQAFAQDSLSSSQDFKKGVLASGISVVTGDQSATIEWQGISFPSSAGMHAGYLLVYSTSTPSLISSPEGSAPGNAVLNGTVVPTTATALPNQPLTTAVSNGLTNGTTYQFMILAYIWDGVNTSSYQYSLPATICATIPPDGPGSLNLSSAGISTNYISGSFAAPLFNPDGYVVTYSTQANAVPLTDGNWYQAGQANGGDTIVQESNDTIFNTNSSGYKLSVSTTYYIHLFSYVLSGCNNKPVYSKDYFSYTAATTPETKQDSASADDSFIEMIDIEPNPVETNAVLKISTMTSDNHVAIAIFTVDGRMIAQRTIAVLTGVNRTSLYTQNLSRGMYILRAQFSNGKIKALPFIKK